MRSGKPLAILWIAYFCINLAQGFSHAFGQFLIFLSISLLIYAISSIFAMITSKKWPKVKLAYNIGIIALLMALLFIDIPFYKAVTPDKYEIELRLFGRFELDQYSDMAKQSMDRNRVIIYCIGTSSGGNWSFDEAIFVGAMKSWKRDYPNVRFFAMVTPNEKQPFCYDGNTDSTILNSKEIIRAIQENSLDNVIGLAYDFEPPIDTEFGRFMVIPNETRHLETIKKWEGFMAWCDSNAPSIQLHAIHPQCASSDMLDADLDLHNLINIGAFEVGFNEFHTMLYRTIEESDSSYEFYVKVKMHQKACLKAKSIGGVFLGIMNGMSPYQSIDAIVDDILICMQFKIASVTFYHSHTTSDAGIFLAFGDDVLDRVKEGIAEKRTVRVRTSRFSFLLMDYDIFYYSLLDLVVNIPIYGYVLIAMGIWGINKYFIKRKKCECTESLFEEKGWVSLIS